MKKIGVFLITFMLFGCFSPASKFYQPIYIKKQNVSYNEFKGAVLLYPVLLPAEISRPQIVTLGKKDFEVKIDEFNRWASQPEKMVQRIINESLSNLLPNANIYNQTNLKKEFKYAVFVEVLELTGRLNEKAMLKASYFIKNKSGKIVKSGNFYEIVAIDGKYDAYIPAISGSLSNLSEDIAKALNDLK